MFRVAATCVLVEDEKLDPTSVIAAFIKHTSALLNAQNSEHLNKCVKEMEHNIG